jgi:glycosyltransferase involved in cell wall biosynthesis
MWLRAAGIPVRQHPQSAAGVPLLKALCLSEGLRRALSEASTSRRVFHTHGLWLKPNIYPAVIGRRRGIPVLHSVHGMLGDAALAFSRGKKRLFDMLFQRRALNHARCLHATSVLEYEDIRRYGLDNPVAIIPNGIEIPVLAPRSAKRADRVLLSLGRIHPKKGLDRLVRAWSVIEAAHPQWVLRLVGPAELGHDEELRALARSLGASPSNPRFTGRQSWRPIGKPISSYCRRAMKTSPSRSGRPWPPARQLSRPKAHRGPGWRPSGAAGGSTMASDLSWTLCRARWRCPAASSKPWAGAGANGCAAISAGTGSAHRCATSTHGCSTAARHPPQCDSIDAAIPARSNNPT